MKAILKRYSKRILTPLLILAICFASVAPPVEVEAKTSTKVQAEKPVKKFYKYAKQFDVNKMFKYVASSSNGSSLSRREQKQINRLAKIIKKQNKKRFSYKIISTKLSGDKKSATVKVMVKYRSLYTAGYYGTAKATNKLLEYYLSHNGHDPSSSKILEWLVKYVKRGVKKYPAKKVTKSVTVRTKKYSSGWRIVSVTDEMLNTYTCDIIKGGDDFAKELD